MVLLLFPATDTDLIRVRAYQTLGDVPNGVRTSCEEGVKNRQAIERILGRKVEFNMSFVNWPWSEL